MVAPKSRRSRSRKSKSKKSNVHTKKAQPSGPRPKIHVEKATGPVRLPSKESRSRSRERPTHAHNGMTMTDLQFMAKSRGIQFGGLSKTQLIEKINRY